MIAACRATIALDDVTGKDDFRAISEAVMGGTLVRAQLLEYEQTAWMTAAQASVLDLLGAGLRSLGERV
jgi:hypothetical protein